jgi:hypothetical protein
MSINLRQKIDAAETNLILKKRNITQTYISLKQKNSKGIVLLVGCLAIILVVGNPVFSKKKSPKKWPYVLRRIFLSTLTIINMSHYARKISTYLLGEREVSIHKSAS